MDDDRDPELTEVIRQVIHLVTREHPLSGNQLHELASQLQRLAVHRITEEHLRKLQPPSKG